MQLEQKIVQQLTQNNKTLSLAESCTGGLLGHVLTNLPGASQFLLLDIVAYDNAAKVKLLKVPPTLLKKYGAVSLQTASAMAQGVRKILKTDYGLAITGIAGPGGGSKEKPVGLVFIAFSSKNNTIAHRFKFKGSRLSIKKQATQTALIILAKHT